MKMRRAPILIVETAASNIILYNVSCKTIQVYLPSVCDFRKNREKKTRIYRSTCFHVADLNCVQHSA